MDLIKHNYEISLWSVDKTDLSIERKIGVIGASEMSSLARCINPILYKN